MSHNDLWNHPLYALSCWWNGGRDVEVLKVSDSRRFAHVKDKVTKKEFCMARAWIIPAIKPGSLMEYDADSEEFFKN